MSYLVHSDQMRNMVVIHHRLTHVCQVQSYISCTLTQPPQLHSREDPIIHSSRRGLLGLIGSFSLGTLLQDSFSSSSYAEASTISSCDFTVAPSGLAFCDISLGSGLPASKGMPIKVLHISSMNEICSCRDIFYENHGHAINFLFP